MRSHPLLEKLKRYGLSLGEQALWSVLNFGINLLLIRYALPVEYGRFAIWANFGYILASLLNAVSVGHLFVMAPGDVRSEPRLSLECTMHTVTLGFVSAVTLAATLVAVTIHFGVQPIDALAPGVYLAGFLLQTYVRSLAFSRGRVRTAAIQTSASLALCLVSVLIFEGKRPPNASEMMWALGLAYLACSLVGLVIAVRGQDRPFHPRWLRHYLPYIKDSGWIFVGVASTELLARFYAFATAAILGPTALAALSATQQLLRPLPLLANSLASVERPLLAQRRDRGDFGGIARHTLMLCLGGVGISIFWTALVYSIWPYVTVHLMQGKYAQDGWMILLWGLASGLGFCQILVSATLQSLRAFKPLAIVNLGAALLAALAILGIIKALGVSGAILGTALGQALELVSMVWLLSRLIPLKSIFNPTSKIMKP